MISRSCSFLLVATLHLRVAESFSLVESSSWSSNAGVAFVPGGRCSHHHQDPGVQSSASLSEYNSYSVQGRISSTRRSRRQSIFLLFASSSGKGFGAGGASSSSVPKIRQTKVKRGSSSSKPSAPQQSTDNTTSSPPPKNRPYVKAEQNVWLEQLTEQAGKTELGRVVATYNTQRDAFWDLMPSLIASKFPNYNDRDLTRISGFVQHALAPDQRPSDWIDLPHRPYDELHAYMPGLLPAPTPFIDPTRLAVCKKLQDSYPVIVREYQALVDYFRSNDNGKDTAFQSVTSMNYDSGWKTLVLFYNGHRIAKFPYHLCPTTTRLLESLPLAGRIAGFNRQAPNSGIPNHTDGNNLWLTCQMGISVPPNDVAYIKVADEQRHWKNGQCMVYDTTFFHQTFNPDTQHERIVLHVDFFNTLQLTTIEISVLQYIYKLREDFMKAEGVAKVGAQVL